MIIDCGFIAFFKGKDNWLALSRCLNTKNFSRGGFTWTKALYSIFVSMLWEI